MQIEPAVGCEEQHVRRAVPVAEPVHDGATLEAEPFAGFGEDLEELVVVSRVAFAGAAHGLMMTGVPSATAPQIWSIASFDTAMQPSVQSPRVSSQASSGAEGMP